MYDWGCVCMAVCIPVCVYVAHGDRMYVCVCMCYKYMCECVYKGM